MGVLAGLIVDYLELESRLEVEDGDGKCDGRIYGEIDAVAGLIVAAMGVKQAVMDAGHIVINLAAHALTVADRPAVLILPARDISGLWLATDGGLGMPAG